MESTIEVKGSTIYIGSAETLLPRLLPDSRVVVISDATIDRLYPQLLGGYETILIGQGESIKTPQTVVNVITQLIEMGADRSTFILGIGGGIVSDVAGFVAAIYMRGVSFGFVSTTLLGQVDASCGGKNGVNVEGFKNIMGTFTQPRFVVCDNSMLSSLSVREFRSGMAEVIKAAIIGDRELFEMLEHSSIESLRNNLELLHEVVGRALMVKAQIVERDECERGERRKLNLGHTIAHAIEKSCVVMNHGEAVAVGVAKVAQISCSNGLLSEVERDRILSLLLNLGFSVDFPVDVHRLVKYFAKDKKSDGVMFNVVVINAIGVCSVEQTETTQFAQAVVDNETI